MGVKRIVDVDFWTDNKVVDMFSPEDRLFMLYLMTNPHTTQLGIYSFNKRIMSFEIGYSVEVINVLLDRFENTYEMIKISNETNEIAIKNYLKFSIIKGGKPVEDLLKKEIKQVKNKSLLNYVASNLKEYDNLNQSVNKILEDINNKTNNNIININNNDNENTSDLQSLVSQRIVKKENEDIYEKIIEYLNLSANTNFRKSSKKTKQLINARLQEKFTFNDFTKVIDNKVADWKGNAKMEMYLRPETLFGTKFESYLNQHISNNKKMLNDYLQENNNLKPINENSNETLEELEDFFNNKN